MDEPLARAVAEWTTVYTLLGGAAATLLGLLFVALSLRLNIFQDRVLAAAGLVGTGPWHALGWLAIGEGGLLEMGTIAACVMLSHARATADGSDAPAL